MSQQEFIKGKDYIGTGGGCLIVNDENEILLMRRAGKVRNESGKWSKPGGGIKFGELAQDAMIREMKEELGIDVEIIGLLPYTDHIIQDEKHHWIALNFIARIVSGKPQNKEPEKCDKVAWFRMNELPKNLTQTTAEPIENYLAGKFIMF